MARYCFYCGRELALGEKCHCRERSYAAGARDGSATQNVGQTPGFSQSEASEEREKTSVPGEETEWTSDPGGQSADFSGRNRFGGTSREARRAERVCKRSETKNRNDARSGYVHRERKDYRSTPGQVRQTMARLVRFFAAPADAMQETLSPLWSRSHLLWLLLALALSGLHYVNLDRRLSSVLSGRLAPVPLERYLLAWLTGSVFVLGILTLYSLTLWLLSRFLFRQGNLPFPHVFAAGKSAWKYLVLFLALALPSTYTAGNIYGVVLALIGLVFAVILHARLVASLTYLDDNRTLQLTVLSIIIFSGLFSTITIFFNMVNPAG